MPIDLKIVEPVGASRSLHPQIFPNSARVDGEFSLVQKILKNLLTAPEESEADPGFGSDLRGAVQGLAGQELQQARQAVTGALQKCVDDLQSDPPNDPSQRIVDLRLVDLRYSATTTSWVASVEAVTEETALTFDVGT